MKPPYEGQSSHYASEAFHCPTVLVAESKFTPTFTTFRPNMVTGIFTLRYTLSLLLNVQTHLKYHYYDLCLYPRQHRDAEL